MKTVAWSLLRKKRQDDDLCNGCATDSRKPHHERRRSAETRESRLRFSEVCFIGLPIFSARGAGGSNTVGVSSPPLSHQDFFRKFGDCAGSPAGTVSLSTPVSSRTDSNEPICVLPLNVHVASNPVRSPREVRELCGRYPLQEGTRGNSLKERFSWTRLSDCCGFLPDFFSCSVQ